ncbi:hypothetical protein FG379_001543 [Cryptosporidium bovis]|uniref:uncharacterized protein n=1 Tax=Cryptosporidium bovis TaxID=310047 RepID=UPI00351A08F2|nr:hypothetical protein FG379_001543 [Cryptosporidium bovis]
MNILSNDSNIFELRNIYKIDSEVDSGKNYSVNKRRKTACEREAIFNRLILNNPSILSVDTTLLPGTCVYCNICQVRIILNPAYYLNNWRTHMNGKLHRALSKAVGSPQFIDEADFFQEKEDSYLDIKYGAGVGVVTSGGGIATIGLDNYENINSVVPFSVEDDLKDENFNNINESCVDNNKMLGKDVKIIEITNSEKVRGTSTECSINKEHINCDIKNKRKHVLDEEDIKENNVNIENYLLESDESEHKKKNDLDCDNLNISDGVNDSGISLNQKYVMHPIISNINISCKDEQVESRDYDNFVKNLSSYENLLFQNEIGEEISNFDEEKENDDNNKDKVNRDNNAVNENTEIVLRDQNFQHQSNKNNAETVASPFLKVNFDKNGIFRCPGINKVRYWAMCFIGSERSNEPSNNINYNDTRRVFYKQSIITKIMPNNEPEHQGVVHHPNCLGIVSRPNQPCERCSLYINNRQLARVISKRATRLQEMWDRVVAGESILNGGTVPQSIISAYNHRIDHWSRCNDPLEAITRALAGCRQRDYTNFFWKIRENLLQNSRLIKNHL